ncbi:MAG: putative LPS assembly protein LptD [Candidatus Tenebribacter davisii]|nr:putative LPS assembly protein LptD [Candidatus Tenebribacter davisii]
MTKIMPIMKNFVNKENAIISLMILFILITVISWTQEVTEETQISLADSLLTDSLQTDQSYQVDSLFYSADSIDYNVEKEIIQLSGNTSVKYHTSTINADTIAIDLKKEQAFAKGKSYLQDGTQNMLGRDINYDLKTKWGLVSSGSSKFDKGFYYGEEIRKIDDDTYDVDKGIFTTCDALHPHFYIQAKEFRFYKNDKFVAKPVVFYVNHFPVFAFPFGTFTLKRGRQSGILVPSPGWNKTKGKYLENIAYYFAYRDHADFTIALDYYELTGWELGFHSLYKKRYNYNGFFNAILQKKIQGPQISQYEWNIKNRHHHDYGNRTTFDMNLNFISSKRVWEGSENLDERLAEKITSSMAFKKPLFNSTLYVNANYIDDLENDIKNITLPSISLTLSPRPVYEIFVNELDDIPKDAWWKDFSYSYKFKATHEGKINHSDPTIWDILYDDTIGSDSTYTTGNQHNAGVKHTASLSYSYKFKGWLNLTQSIYGNENWFDRDKNNVKFARGLDYNTNSILSFNIYGIRTIPGFYVSAIRHIITPKVSYIYHPDFSDNEKFYNFGSIGLSYADKSKKVSFSLGNKWQLKLAATKNVKERKINDFFTINSSTSYDYEKDEGFSNILHTLKLRPNKINFGIFDLSTYPQGNITQETYGLDVKGWDPGDWDLAVLNWNFKLTSSLKISGDAKYVDYFPLEKNDFITGDFFNNDSLDIDAERTVTTLEELDELKQEEKNWSISLSHDYKLNKVQYESNEYISSLRTAVSARVTKNWSISYANYIDLKTEEMVSHNFTISRDLHCWKIIFKYTKQGDYWNYKFQLFDIKLPDALKFRTSDHN